MQTTIELESGITVDLGESIDRFFEEEWAYYDGLPDRDPLHILPDDVLATVAMNSFVNDAAKVRSVHRGMAEACDPLLALIPPGADLLSFDPELELALRLFDAACGVRGVLMPVATKVLHRKRPGFIPMLDGVVMDVYLDAMGLGNLRGKTQDGTTAGGVGVAVLDAFRADLAVALDPLSAAVARLDAAGTPVSALRLLEVAVWIATEPRGYYRVDESG